MPAGQTSVCQLQTGTRVHARLCANLHCVHCRLSRCIGSVVMHLEHTSVLGTLQSRAVAEPQQVTICPFRVTCSCGGCTITLCQALALLCLLMNHVLRSSCRLSRHMLMQEVRATALDVLQHGTPGLENQKFSAVYDRTTH